jgi:hypothetical protein
MQKIKNINLNSIQGKPYTRNWCKSKGSDYLSSTVQHLRQVFINFSAGKTLMVTARTPIGKLSKQQLITTITAFISSRFPSEVINLFRCADRHTATSMCPSSGSVIKILVQIKDSAFSDIINLSYKIYNTK